MCAPQLWWGLMIALCFTGIGLEIACLASPRWFEQGSSNNHWEGGLLTPYPSETWYKDKTCDRDYHRDGYCDMFKRLWIGGLVYVVFESLSLLFFAISIGLFAVYMNKKSGKCLLATIMVWIAVTSHFVAFVSWAVLGKMKYKGTCDRLYEENGDKPAKTCRKEGATLALITILYIPLIAFLQTLLWYYTRERPAETAKAPKVDYKAPEENPEMSSREVSSREYYSESIEPSV